MGNRKSFSYKLGVSGNVQWWDVFTPDGYMVSREHTEYAARQTAKRMTRWLSKYIKSITISAKEPR